MRGHPSDYGEQGSKMGERTSSVLAGIPARNGSTRGDGLNEKMGTVKGTERRTGARHGQQQDTVTFLGLQGPEAAMVCSFQSQAGPWSRNIRMQQLPALWPHREEQGHQML